jgi:DNA topoisomerase VI subunit A|tara:strand:- start:462 stop:572 length:111 start_codon:yes stop_codon:yes gene_type:complete
MQSREMVEVTINIQYLEEQIRENSISEMREVFYMII